MDTDSFYFTCPPQVYVCLCQNKRACSFPRVIRALQVWRSSLGPGLRTWVQTPSRCVGGVCVWILSVCCQHGECWGRETWTAGRPQWKACGGFSGCHVSASYLYSPCQPRCWCLFIHARRRKCHHIRKPITDCPLWMIWHGGCFLYEGIFCFRDSDMIKWLNEQTITHNLMKTQHVFPGDAALVLQPRSLPSVRPPRWSRLKYLNYNWWIVIKFNTDIHGLPGNEWLFMYSATMWSRFTSASAALCV